MIKSVFLCLIVANLFAQTAEYLRPQMTFTAKEKALGNTSTASNASAFSLFNNPALLQSLKTNSVHLNSEFNNYYEDRKYPTYSAFDSRNGNEVYVSNYDFRNDFSFAVNYRIELAGESLNLAFAHAKVYDSDYFYQEYVRQNHSSAKYLLAAQEIDAEGDIVSNALALSGTFSNLDYGITLNLLTGNGYRMEKRIKLSSSAVENKDYNPNTLYPLNSKIDYRLENQALNVIIGFIYQILPNLRSGLSYQTPFQLDLKEGTALYSFHMPDQFAIGLEYMAGNAIGTKLSLDFKYYQWKDFKITRENFPEFKPFNQNVSLIGIGIEQLLGANKLPLRLGAVFYNNRSISDFSTVNFTAGSSLELAFLQMDFAFNYGYQTYSEADLFPENIWLNQNGQAYSNRNSRDIVNQSKLSFDIDFIYQF